MNNLLLGEGMVGMKQASYCPKQLFDEAVDVSNVCLNCALCIKTMHDQTMKWRQVNDKVPAIPHNIIRRPLSYRAEG